MSVSALACCARSSEKALALLGLAWQWHLVPLHPLFGQKGNLLSESESESKSNFQVTVEAEAGVALALPMWHIRPDFKVFQLAFELIATVGNAVIKAIRGKTL